MYIQVGGNNTIHHFSCWGVRVSWLILLPTGLGWYIVGYESEPLPYYINLRNCSHSIMFKYTDSPSTLQVHLPCPGTTISSSGSYLDSAPPRCRVHKWGGMSPFPLWLPAASECTTLWGVFPRFPVPPLPGDITTPGPPHV